MEFIKKYFNPLLGVLTIYYKIETNVILGSLNQKLVNLCQSCGIEEIQAEPLMLNINVP